MMSNQDHQNIVHFIFELGVLRRIHREGWKLIGVDTPESVAEHSLRAAQIGYILAKLEGYPHPEEICLMLIFHDIAECRIGDIHKVANRYLQKNEKQAVKEQLQGIPHIEKEIFNLWEQMENQSTTAGIIAKDADLLELAATAREYLEQGMQNAQDWLKNTSKRLRTPSAKKLLDLLMTTNPYDWWNGLKKIP